MISNIFVKKKLYFSRIHSAELVSMLLRRGAPVDAVCTLAPDPSSPQCTPLQGFFSMLFCLLPS